MKNLNKFCLIIALVSFGIASIAQINISQIGRLDNEGKTKKKSTFINKQRSQKTSNSHSLRGTSAVIWSDDFSNPANWSFTHDTGTDDWKIDAIGATGQYKIGPIASPTASNGFATFDSDLACSGDQIANLNLATAIDLTGKNAVELKFYQLYARYYDSTFVYISLDNFNWTKFVVNPTLVPLTTSTPEGETPNPDLVTIDISTLAGGKSTVYLRFTFWSPSSLGASAGCGYSWMIDDVSIEDKPTLNSGVNNITSPVSGCNLTATENVTISIHNYGLSAITGFEVAYILNNNTPVVENVGTLSISPDSNGLYTFATKVDISTPGIDTLIAYTLLTGDPDATNDTSKLKLYSTSLIDLQISSLTNTFESSSEMLGWNFVDANADQRTFILMDDPAGYQIPTYSGTGSSSLYASPSLVADDWIMSPCFSLVSGKSYRVSFFYNTAGPAHSINIYYGSKPTPGSMTNLIEDLGVVANTTFEMYSKVFTASADGIFYLGIHDYGDAVANPPRWISIDNISLSAVFAVDAGVLNVSAPVSGNCSLSNLEPITATFMNFGANSISDLNVSYQVNSGNVVRETIPGAILPDSTVTYTFNTKADLSPMGSYTIVVSDSLPGDLNSNNNSKTKMVASYGSYLASDFVNSFESPEEMGGWTTQNNGPNNDSWVSYTIANLAYDGSSFLAYSPSDSTAGADDWYFTPCLNLKAGQKYDLSFFFRGQTTAFAHKFEIQIGDSATELGMKTLLLDTTFSNDTYEQFVKTFQVLTDGVYYIGFRIKSDPSSQFFLLDMISISKQVQTAKPVANFTFINNQLTVNFTDVSTGGPTSWSWNFGDGSALSTVQNPSHTYTSSGKYSTCLTVSNDSGSNTKCDSVLVLAISVNPITLSNSINVFPNPAKDHIIILSDVKNVGNFISIKLYNIVGIEVDNFQLNESNVYKVKNLPEGAYFISIDTENGKINKKIFISR